MALLCFWDHISFVLQEAKKFLLFMGLPIAVGAGISAGGAVDYDERSCGFHSSDYDVLDDTKSSCRTGANGVRKTTTMDVIATCAT